jgi:NADH pyrophosphatase NudC (nudix superfamily)
LSEEEISEVRWFSVDRVDQMLLEDGDVFSPTFAIVWRLLKQS